MFSQYFLLLCKKSIRKEEKKYNMKRRLLEQHLLIYGCKFLRSGNKLDIWVNPETKRQGGISRHSAEISKIVIAHLCRQLMVPSPI
jgi:hypothetical protein